LGLVHARQRRLERPRRGPAVGPGQRRAPVTMTFFPFEMPARESPSPGRQSPSLERSLERRLERARENGFGRALFWATVYKQACVLSA
jgi:hypothetical protein